MLRTQFVLILLFAGLPLIIVGCLRQQPPLITSFMLQSAVKPVDYQWVPAAQIAEVARKAVVASEDQKFWSHEGFDLEAMEQAHRDNQKRRSKRGASTISQQTAKNLFLWPGGGYVRKGIEAYFTVLIELLWPKARILEVYLNIAEFGPGIYGVEAAAQRFFNKPAAQLTPSEAARLAAVLPNPKRWNAERPGSYVMARSEWILRQMGYGPRKPDPEDAEPPEPPEQAVVPQTPPLDETVPPAEPPIEAPEAGPDPDWAFESPAQREKDSLSGGRVTDEPLQDSAPQSSEPDSDAELTL